jgi:UDP-N-acetylmuramoyl-tripeptide--D-alanyl-D-alanine ligase
MEMLSDAARRLNAALMGNDARYTMVTSDSRKLQPGDLFVALKGEHFDGHDFVAKAGSLGAVGALVSRRINTGLAQIVVPDTLTGLQALARSWRRDFRVPVVAVTGSNGKTTTRQMLAAIFAARGPVLATEGNLNNHIGLPLTLLKLRAEHRTAVIEMGANHPGEIAQLASIAEPQIGIVTQAGDAHLEGFGSREGVARAKGELFTALRADGLAVINRDDAYYPLWRGLIKQASAITFGFDDAADVRALNVVGDPLHAPAAMRFELQAPSASINVRIPLPGRHNVMNALAAAAAGIGAGLSLQQIAAGLAQVQAAGGRLTWRTTTTGARIIDDTYNANPTSLGAALELLSTAGDERIAVLGNMGELGPDAARLHRECGEKARALGIDALFTLGDLAREAAAGFGTSSRHFDSVEALAAELKPLLKSGVTVLVKGSRSARMERVVAALTGEEVVEAH